MLLAGGVFLVTALSWLTIVSLTPVADQPFPIGSSDGSVWNVAFVYNGINRVVGPPATHRRSSGRLRAPPGPRFQARPTGPSGPRLGAQGPPRRRQSQRHRRHRGSPPFIRPPGLTRLFGPSRADYGVLIGVPLLAALLFGAAALALARGATRTRAQRAALAGVVLWLGTGLVLYSLVNHVQLRYLEGFTPAVAVGFGVGVGAVLRRVRGTRLVLISVLAPLGAVVLDARAATGADSTQRAGLAIASWLAVATAGLALGALVWRQRRGDWPGWWGPVIAGGLVTVSLLALPVAADVKIISSHASDQSSPSGYAPPMAARILRYLRGHTSGQRYELAASAPTFAQPFIIADQRPVLLLTTYAGRHLLTLAALEASAARGEVSYLVTRRGCSFGLCPPTVRWAIAHGTDVTPQIAPGHHGEVYRLLTGPGTRSP